MLMRSGVAVPAGLPFLVHPEMPLRPSLLRRCRVATSLMRIWLAAAVLWLGGSAAHLRGDAETLISQAAAEQSRQISRLGAESWHAAGYRGQGVKVAILDSGF